ncbi:MULTISPECIES: chemotaxis protein CheW [Vibrio]|uniref:chemotaxis protein CheW n=1 Tax=Vibrio TaxID=662 RepID=UPI001BD36B79|nr:MULTISPECIES: chemotaxis protein CheW [Vibrio]MBS9880444.1 chemotaxis protein CheW [Vibrio alginolyticus]MDW2024505.1 chemotaxis protein CheW [Vibrio sp. 397]MDW2029466.1 chemotaxis protein CheW [Vibrio sp. 399]MDW2215516.1 chemotaxis protein CheW [Vibrio sp. 1982]
MSSNDVLSSEQALDDYFNALLDDETEITTLEEDFDLLAQEVSSAEPEPELQLQYSEPETYQFQETYPPELEAPNLEDVQRLLSQLEASNPVAELDIDSILEQNTIDIAAEIKAAEPEVQTFSEVPELQGVEEIQDWVIDEPVFEEAQPEVDEPHAVIEQSINIESNVDTELETQADSDIPTVWESTKRSEDFQVLYFDVNGVTFAVPLDELGGIHRISELNHLIGKPAWYLGLQTNREQQFDVVDTAKWVMADKLRDDSYKDNYQYVVMLGESMWGLASNQLMGTETLNIDKVRWREQAGKRPWLAGMVKEKMCALIHVQALIDMLNAGLDVKSLN